MLINIRVYGILINKEIKTFIKKNSKTTGKQNENKIAVI